MEKKMKKKTTKDVRLMTVTIDRAILARLQKVAKDDRRSRSNMVGVLLAEAMDARERAIRGKQ